MKFFVFFNHYGSLRTRPSTSPSFHRGLPAAPGGCFEPQPSGQWKTWRQQFSHPSQERRTFPTPKGGFYKVVARRYKTLFSCVCGRGAITTGYSQILWMNIVLKLHANPFRLKKKKTAAIFKCTYYSVVVSLVSTSRGLFSVWPL